MMMSNMVDQKNKEVLDFFQKLAMSSIVEKPRKDNIGLPFYSDLSNRVLQNLDKNYDLYLSYSPEDENAPDYFINNFNTFVKDKNNYDGIKNLSPENIKVIVFNKYASMTTVNKELTKLKNDKNTNYFIIFKSFVSLMDNSAMSFDSSGAPLLSMDDIDRLITNKPKNVNYILLDNRDNIYNVLYDSEVGKMLSEYQNMQIPILGTNSAKEQLVLTKSFVQTKIGKKIDNDAIEFACDIVSDQDGSKYDLVLKFLQNAASYLKDVDVITKNDLSSYWESIQKEDTSIKNASYDIIFDTKMSLDDIVGSGMVKKQAAQVVYEIKNFPKTKGYIIYNAYGYGGGSLNCAKAIAGQAGIPMVTINAGDFAVRDLDAVNDDPMEAINLKMTKLINLIKTQAKANPNKTVMLFISNFDRFGSDPVYGMTSLYEEQAFKRLLIEMKKASQDKSYNIVVIGSSDYPSLKNENIERPDLFMDDIVIYPPSNKKEIIEIIKDHVKNKNYEFTKSNSKKENEVILHIADVLKDASYIEIVDVIDKANIISKSKGKNSISIEDINEAYLSRIVGPTNEIDIDEKHKHLIIRHECGHALNLQFMYNLLRKTNDTLRLPDLITNVVLDPRSDFLGCIFHTSSYENLYTECLETLFSRIVCSFGGNSAEQYFYNMPGSWGISQDLQNANHYAKTAVLDMGLGKHMNYYIPDVDPDSGIVSLTQEDEYNYNKDVKVLLNNAKILSDKIVECYSGFIKEFSDKYVDKFATGECVMTGHDFARLLAEWEKRQSPQKRKEIYKLKKQAMDIIKCTAESKDYSIFNKLKYNIKSRVSKD